MSRGLGDVYKRQEYVSAKEGVLLGQYYECMFIYFGNGIAYYHEEWEGGSKGEYLLNGKTKGRRVGER